RDSSSENSIFIFAETLLTFIVPAKFLQSVKLCGLARLEFTVNGFTRSFHACTLHSGVALKNAAAYDNSRSYAALTHAEVEFSDFGFSSFTSSTSTQSKCRQRVIYGWEESVLQLTVINLTRLCSILCVSSADTSNYFTTFVFLSYSALLYQKISIHDNSLLMNEPVGRISALKFLLAARQTTHAYSHDSHEQREWITEKKANINAVEFAQPSIDTGNFGIGGLGRPKVPHKQTQSAVIMPIIVPISLALSLNIPRVKMPKIGPPMEP
ncbi:hypothetical protein ALC56_09320, partial [Trachymyrmex septentrionalis]